MDAAEELEAGGEADEAEYDTVRGVFLPQLDRTQRYFYDLVSRGNTLEVKSFLQERPNFNVNFVNYQNISPLHVAVRQKNVQLIEILLAIDDIDCGDTALHAIREREIDIALMILDKKREKAVILEYEPAISSAEFVDETTPLDIAAQYGHYDMVKLLSERGHKIPKPHKPNCYCDEICKARRAIEDPLTLEKFRLTRYRAIANPAYICYNSQDPFLEAFLLYVELGEAASYERSFYKAYKNLAEKVAQFGTDLIACARKTEEVEIVLRQKSGLKRPVNFIFPRLLLAMECKQKTFVAHPNVQQVIENNWIGDWYEWKSKSATKKVLIVLARIPMLPMIVIMLILAPNARISKKWKIPVNRYLSGVSTYVIFLTFLLVESNIDKKKQLRGPPRSGLEIVLVVYVISYIWASIRHCMIYGASRYFRSHWNWYEVAMLFLFVLTFFFWGMAEIDVRHSGQRDLDRKYWHRYDPTLIAEGLFCIATIMAFFKLMFVFQLDYHLGPLQMSLGKMSKDVTKFLFLFMIILLAFSSGMAKLYQYYDGMVQIDDDTKIKTQQAGSFVDFQSSLKTLFWAIFCMSAIESADVVIENLPGETDDRTIINKHTFTEMIGYLAFACFEIISVVVVLNMPIACMAFACFEIISVVVVFNMLIACMAFACFEIISVVVVLNMPIACMAFACFEIISVVVVLNMPIACMAFACFEIISVVVVLNMLIACMSNTFTRFTENVDVEWTFGRTEVYVDMMAHDALPPPFNLLPTGNEFQRVAEFIKLLIRPTPETKARWSFKRCCYIERTTKENPQKFRLLMGQLVMRYFRVKEFEAEESDTVGLRRDLAKLRDVVREAMETPP